jgi:hypothetical protein
MVVLGREKDLSTGESGPAELPLVVGRDGESRPGVDEDAIGAGGATPNTGFLRRPRRGVSSAASSLCDARKRLPKGEFLSPDMVESRMVRMRQSGRFYRQDCL